MTNKEKKELFIALCGYYPYGVICHDTDPNDQNWSKDGKLKAIKPVPSDCNGLPYLFDIEGMSSLSDICEIKPYLRPMESMTEEEKYIWHSKMKYVGYFINYKYYDTVDSFDYLNSIHVDYRGLIPKGLALPAKEGMYKARED